MRSVARNVLPGRIRGWLWFLRSRDLRLALAAARRVRNRLGSRVVSGPFRGMPYVTGSVGSAYPPKLLGTYEKELWGVIESLPQRQYEAVVDIGAAEGYYAVGLARLLPTARVVAFEATEERHWLLRSLAKLNGVADRITLQGFCTPGSLRDLPNVAGRTLVICDVEGAEIDLLDPAAVGWLARADVLVELHDFLRPKVTETIRSRFGATHQISYVAAQARTVNDFPKDAAFVPEKYWHCAMAEHRGGGQGWFWLRAADPSKNAVG